MKSSLLFTLLLLTLTTTSANAGPAATTSFKCTTLSDSHVAELDFVTPDKVRQRSFSILGVHLLRAPVLGRRWLTQTTNRIYICQK